MKFRLHRTLRLGPIRIHLTERGFSSWGVQLGRWSWNARTRAAHRRHPGLGLRPDPRTPLTHTRNAPSRSTGTDALRSSSAAISTSSG